MHWQKQVFVLLCGCGIAGGLSLELFDDHFWGGTGVVIYGISSYLLLLLVAAMLRLPGNWRSIGSAAYLAAVVSIWPLPLSPIERFVHDVGRLQAGMSAAQVDQVMAEHVKGASLSGADGKSVIPRQPVLGSTYYEPRGQSHSFDTCALVAWQGERVAKVELHLD